MIISVSQSHHDRGVEDLMAADLFPEHIRDSASGIVEFIKLYYKWLNEVGLPSREISDITSNHDIDQASDKYLSEISKQIAAAIPESRTLDKVRLYKLIFAYYKKRGSDDSVYSFFKIFFNEIVTLFYPKERLFNSSGTRSKSSNINRLQDSYYWQDFSYVIKSENDSSEWYNEFLKFVHPAGLKLFTAVLIIAFAQNNWEQDLDVLLYDTVDPEEYWKNIRWPELVGMHTPKFQPGWDRDMNLGFIYKTLVKDSGNSWLLKATVLITIAWVVQNQNHREYVFREDYQAWLKYLDPLEMESAYQWNTIAEAMDIYRPTNEARFSSLSSYVNIFSGDIYDIDLFLFDDEDRDALFTEPFLYRAPSEEEIFVAAGFSFAWTADDEAYCIFDTTDPTTIFTDGGGPELLEEWNNASPSPNAIEALSLNQIVESAKPTWDSGTAKVIFAADDSLNWSFPLEQNGWAVFATSRGTFSFGINEEPSNGIAFVGIDTTTPGAGDFYGLTLLPETVYPWQVDVERTRLIAEGAAANSTGSLANLFKGQDAIVHFRKSPIVAVTSFGSTWMNCSNLVTFAKEFFDLWSPVAADNGCFVDAWTGCTSLNLASVVRILTSIDVSGVLAPPVGPDITIDYDETTGSLPPSILPIVSSLVSKGWTVTVNGGDPLNPSLGFLLSNGDIALTNNLSTGDRILLIS